MATVTELLTRADKFPDDLDCQCCGLIEELAEALREAVTWRAMDTAPKDGSEVLLTVELRAGMRGRMLVGHFMPGGHCIEDHPPIDRGWYFWNGSRFDGPAKPIGWRPLPPAYTKDGP